MSNEKKQTMDIDIPATAYVTCPIDWRYKLVNVEKKCCKCKYFGGLYALENVGNNLPFNKHYSVNCGHPTVRDIVEVEI